jgi:DNA-binding response OmpR family regulator
MNIMLLDDEKAILASLTNTLIGLGHEVQSVDNAKAAVELIETGEFDFALVDYMMPENNGIWFMQNANVPSTTKVLLMTAFVDRDVINEMFKLGARGYLIKPFAEEELKTHLDFHSQE